MGQFHQFDFEIVRKSTGNRRRIRALATDVELARSAIDQYLGGHWSVPVMPLVTVQTSHGFHEDGVLLPGGVCVVGFDPAPC